MNLHLHDTLIKPLLTYKPLVLSQTAYTKGRNFVLFRIKHLDRAMISWDQFIMTSEFHEENYLCTPTGDIIRAWQTNWLNRLNLIFRSGWRSGLCLGPILLNPFTFSSSPIHLFCSVFVLFDSCYIFFNVVRDGLSGPFSYP